MNNSGWGEDVRSDFRKYIFWVVIAGLLILSFIVIRPYLVALFTSFVLAYLVKPVYDRISKGLGKSLAAIFCILLVLSVLILPVGILIGGISQQAYGYLAGDSAEIIFEKLSSLPYLENADFRSINEMVVKYFVSVFSSALLKVPSLVLAIFVALFGMFFILVEWDKLILKLKEFIPFKDREGVSRDISQTTNALVYGTLFVALIEFAVGALGLYLSGVNSYLLLSAIVFFFAFIPGLGPTIVWVPLAIYYFAIGSYGILIGVVITGIVLSLVIDIILRAKILGKKARINPVIMIVGILGGISVFGVFGFIIGPLILVYTIKLIEEGIKRR
jgi:predicted PurR-regulated permease PerM